MRPILVVLALWSGCTAKDKDEVDETEAPSVILGVKASKTWELPGLKSGGHVVFTEMGVPHVYAKDPVDLARIEGFVVARDRYFFLDLIRRLSTGTVSGLLGDQALSQDIEARGIGMLHVTEAILAAADADPVLAARMDAYADGINAYIAAVREGDLDPPSELALAAPLLGYPEPVDAMKPYSRRDVAAIGGTVMFQLGYETDDIGVTNDLAAMDGAFDGAPLEALREAGMWADLWNDVSPEYEVSPADGYGTTGTKPPPNTRAPRLPKHLDRQMLSRLDARFEKLDVRRHRPQGQDFGSNAWAVAGSASADGRALFAADGHLELSIPSLLYPIGLDTAELGGEGLTQAGLLIVGLPFLAQGTNGKIAWGTTQLGGDITDWYADQIELGADGRPQRSLTAEGWQDLQKVDETYEIANVTLLGSKGRTETWSRWITADGRWITAIEGAPAEPDTVPEAGKAVVTMLGDFIIPGDTDGDGIVSALSFDYTALDGGTLLQLFNALGEAQDVVEAHAATKKSLALSQNIVAADTKGNILYTGYQMVPCRTHLSRDKDGVFAPDQDPTLVMDPTVARSFTIPIAANGDVDESFAADPQRCVIPHAEYPHTFNPPEGFVATANNDVAGLSFDDDLFNDGLYIGGPWEPGWRAEAISRRLAERIADGGATLDDMADIQAHRESNTGRVFVPYLISALEEAQAWMAAESPPTDPADIRMVAYYEAHAEDFTEVLGRMRDWRDGGYRAASGVDTFYETPLENDHADAVATMIYNVWIGDFQRAVLDDEGVPGRALSAKGSGRLKKLHTFLKGRGTGNPEGLLSFNPDTLETAYFDDRGTPDQVEVSDELALKALEASLAFLASEPLAPDRGGFGTDDQDRWIWGLRQQVKFESLLASYLPDDPLLTPLLEDFAITTARLPLESTTEGAEDLTWFPRGGDKQGIDASGNSLSGRDFQYGSGPVDRIRFALGKDGVEGHFIVPGGSSGLIDSEHFADQTTLWLANKTLPMRLTPAEVVEGAVERWAFDPE